MFVFAVGVLLGVQVGVRVLMYFKPLVTPPLIAPLFGGSFRKLYRNPARVLDFLTPQRGGTVLDVGCGTGVFALEAARRVGPLGKVHALDLQASMIDRLQARLAATDIVNIETHVESATHLPFPDASIDQVLMISVLPTIADRGVALSEVFRVLRPGGTLVVGEELLEPDYVRAVTIQRWAESAGFNLVRSEGWAIEYLLKFTRPITQVDMVREAASQA
jgi:ubiquinone/menaquinone biosynthesis C-methylase UbiE